MRLDNDTLGKIPAAAAKPGYDRTQLRTGIIHLGLGAFARAHLCAYVEEAVQAGDLRWGIAGVSMRKPDVVAQLKPQDGLYSLLVRSSDAIAARISGILTGLYVLPENPAAVIDAMAHADVKIVSLTVTEKGYCHDPATGALNIAHPDIMHDLANPQAPRSAIGVLVAGLEERRARHLPAFTILSCDNLPSNGHVVRGLVLAFAELRDAALAAWIKEKTSFPCAMVDRIVPASTDADRADARHILGVDDAGVISCEPFRQWVIEDNFCAARPAWERHGAQMVQEVAPFEFMKLRMLNGAHSSLAYLGFLAGHEFVSDASGDPLFAQFLQRLWAEIIPTVPPPPDTDLRRYANELLARFQNTAIKHRTWQIAMDGSQKLPQRLLGTIRDRLAKNQPIDALAFGVAGWMRYVMGRDEKGAAIDVRDPLASRFAALLEGKRDGNGIAAALLSIESIFGKDLPANAQFVRAVAQALDSLLARGARASVAALA